MNRIVGVTKEKNEAGQYHHIHNRSRVLSQIISVAVAQRKSEELEDTKKVSVTVYWTKQLNYLYIQCQSSI